MWITHPLAGRLFHTARVKKSKPAARYSPMVAAFVVNRHAEGWSDAAIARALGVHQTTVLKWRRDVLELPANPQAVWVPRFPAADPDPDKVREVYAAGATDRQMGRALGTHHTTAGKYRRRLGLPALRRFSRSATA